MIDCLDSFEGWLVMRTSSIIMNDCNRNQRGKRGASTDQRTTSSPQVRPPIGIYKLYRRHFEPSPSAAQPPTGRHAFRFFRLVRSSPRSMRVDCVVSEITSVWVRDSLFSLLASLPEFLYISFTVGPCFPKLFDKVRSRIVFQQKFALSTSDEPHSLCD